MQKITDSQLISDITRFFYRGGASSLCEDGREFYYIAERYVWEKLEPFLDENAMVELERYGIFCFKSRKYDGTYYEYLPSLDYIHLVSA